MFEAIEKMAGSDDRKKFDFSTNVTSFDNDDKKVKADKLSADNEYQNLLEMEPEVVLRRHNRQYLRSISTTTSNDAMSSDDDDDETLDMLSPLPRVSIHERSLSEEVNRQLLGTKTLRPISIHSDNEQVVEIPTKLFFSSLDYCVDKNYSARLASMDKSESGRLQRDPNLLRKVLRRRHRQEVNLLGR